MLASHLLDWLLIYRYVFILPLTIVEGPLLMILCGMLIRWSILAFLPTYLLLVSGDLIGDVCWYAVGRWAGKPVLNKVVHFFGIDPANLHVLEQKFRTHQAKILFTSKVTLGLGFSSAVLLAAGMTRVPLRLYILINLLGGLVWTAILLAVGFLFGHVYLTLSGHVRILFLVIWLVLVVSIFNWLKRFFRLKLGEKGVH